MDDDTPTVGDYVACPAPGGGNVYGTILEIHPHGALVDVPQGEHWWPLRQLTRHAVTPTRIDETSQNPHTQ